MRSYGSINMVKVLSFRFHQCFGSFTMLLVEGSSETGPFRNLSNHIFRSPEVQKYISYEGHLCLKMFTIEYKFRQCKKNWEKLFRFCDNCIWTCCNELPLLRRDYLSSAVNGLNNSPKILHITKTDVFQLNCLHRDQ